MEMWRMSLQIMQKNFNQILGLLIRNMISKKVNLLCFTKFFFKKIKNVIIHQKNYKIVIENVLSQPEICRVINIKCFSENLRTLSNFWCRVFLRNYLLDYWIITVKWPLDVYDGILNLSLHLPSVDFS